LFSSVQFPFETTHEHPSSSAIKSLRTSCLVWTLRMLASLALRLLLAGPCLCAGLKVDAGYPGRVLETGLHTIGNRTFYVQLPLRSSVNKFPVVIVLPPTGELDRKFMDTWGHKLDPKLPAHLQHIIVAPHGLYQSNRTTSPAGVTKSTQAPAESVGADTQSDFEFIEALIDHLGEFPNVNGDFRLYGKYRGAELGFQRDHTANRTRAPALASRQLPPLTLFRPRS